MINIMKRVVAVIGVLTAVVLLILVLMIPRDAKAAVWATPYGLVSNVCVAPDGSFMAFPNQYGLLHTPCRFKYFNSPYVYYGTWE